MDWDWMSRYRGSGAAEPADPADETVINGAPYDPKENEAPTRQLPVRSEVVGRKSGVNSFAVVRYVAAMPLDEPHR